MKQLAQAFLLLAYPLFAEANIHPVSDKKPYPQSHPYAEMDSINAKTWCLNGHRIANWIFESGKSDYMIFENDTFENVTFRNSDFVHTILRNNIFLNCRFEHVTFAGGEWVGNRHVGGVMQKVELGNVENPFVGDDSTGPRNTRIDSNVIENAEVSGWFFGGGFPDAFTITNLTFRNCHLWNNDMDNAVKVTGRILMDSCDIGERAWSMRKGLRQRKCRQSQFVDWIVGQRVDSMRVLNVDGDSVIDVVSDAKGGPRKQRYAMARKYARNVQFRNLDQSQVGGGEDILIEDVHGDHVDLTRSYAPADTVYIRRATLRNLDVKALRLGLPGMVYEDCLFENIKTDELELREAIFRRCTFRNVRIRKELSHWSQKTRFEGCTFENVHRDAGVEIRRFLDPYDPKWTPYTNQRLPWESEEEWQRVQKKPWWKLW